jgi:hypothetical protein
MIGAKEQMQKANHTAKNQEKNGSRQEGICSANRNFKERRNETLTGSQVRGRSRKAFSFAFHHSPS